MNRKSRVITGANGISVVLLTIGIAIVVAIFFVLVTIFKWLWNITMPEVFNLKAVTFWQAFRILLLASILFGGHRAVEYADAEPTPPSAGVEQQ